MSAPTTVAVAVPEWDGDTDSDGAPCNFLNTYECDDCDTAWEDRWSCACDDDCPKCGADISPTCSDITNLKTGEVDHQKW